MLHPAHTLHTLTMSTSPKPSSASVSRLSSARKKPKRSKTKKSKPKIRVEGELKNWNWAFQRLWEFCGPVNPACVLNIPDTILFKNAEPTMWLWTNPGGRIARHEFEFKIQAGEQRAPVDEKMRLIRERFLELRPNGGHLCVVW